MSGRGRGNNANAEPLNRNFATSRGRGRGAGAAGMPPPGGPNAPARLPFQEFAEPNPQPIVDQNVQPPAPANMGLSYRGGRGRGAFEPNPPRAHARNVDPAHRATLDNRPPTDRHHGHGQDIQARRDRDHHFDASGGDRGVAAAIPAAPYMHQPAAYGQLPPQNQPMQQVSPAYGYGGGIAGQQGYQQPEPIQLHQQPGTSHQMDQQQLALSPFPAPDPANHIPFDSQRMAQMFDQVSELFANMASEMGKMNQNNGSNY